MEYLTTAETTKQWSISTGRVHTLCVESRVIGAAWLCNMWAIPIDAQKPDYARIKKAASI